MKKVQLVFLSAHKYIRWNQWFLCSDDSFTPCVGDMVEAPFSNLRQNAVVIDIAPANTEDLESLKTMGRCIVKNAFPHDLIGFLLFFSKKYFCSPAYFLQKILLDEDITRFSFPQNNNEKNTPRIIVGTQFSQKNTILMKEISMCISQKAPVLYLFPSVFSALHAHAHFSKIFPEYTILCLHSALTKSQKKTMRNTILINPPDIIIATATGFFMPKIDWGMVIVHQYDDESYRELSFPYVHFGKMALEWCKTFNIPCIASSVQGGVEEWYDRDNKYSMSISPPIKTPTVYIADMNMEKENGNASPLSSFALQSIAEAIDKKQQVLLFLNRKGLHWTAMCEQCFYTPLSPFSGLKMGVFPHKNGSVLLRCTQSGYTEFLSKNCPKCGSPWKMIGSGTQEIENILTKHFPHATLVRIDKDAMNGIKTMKKTIDDILENTVDIIVCTSFAIKGFAFPNTSLVIDVVADTHFLFSAIGSEESSLYQLRSLLASIGNPVDSQFIIQTSVPRSPLFHNFTDSSTEWVKNAWNIRKQFMHPPFSLAVCMHKNAKKKSTIEEHFLLWQKKYKPWFFQLFPPSIYFFEKKQIYEGKMQGFLRPEFQDLLFLELVEVSSIE